MSSDPSLATSLDTTVDNFLMAIVGTGDDPFSTLVYEADPSAFTSTIGTNSLGDVVGDLIPLNTAGDIAAGLDLVGYSVGLDYFGNPWTSPGKSLLCCSSPGSPSFSPARRD